MTADAPQTDTPPEPPAPPNPRRVARWAALAGLALAVICHLVPPDFRVICDAVQAVCSGGLR